MISKFFINRPIFATVIALVILLAGGVTLISLPIAQYPEITPPTVTVSAYYYGASAQTIAESVAVPIESQVNGVEGSIYMSSTSTSSGVYKLTVTFDVGTDIDMATVLVQNRVNIATSSLPSDVTRNGITVKKESTNTIFFMALKSANPKNDALYLTNYSKINIIDELSRVPGVGNVQLMGADDYSMRIWLDPDLMRIRNITPKDVYNVLSAQNVQVAAGKIGEEPSGRDVAFQYTLSTPGRLITEEEFGEIIVKTLDNGANIKLKDIAKIELGSKSYMINSQLKGGSSVAAFLISQLPGANAMQVATSCREKMEELSKYFAEDVEYEIVLDTTEYTQASINEVYSTFFEALILVLIVILLFLQDWRAVLIPTITIPVSLVGTFAFMGLLGFSINTLTLFGLILAIGIVVDDAIVVVENCSRFLEEGNCTPKEAAIKSMEEVSGSLVGIVLVLLAVFIPTAFIQGMTGALYKQFALTIAVSTLLSGINALTLSPAMCALLLRPHKESNFFIFKYFNLFFDKLIEWFGRVVHGFLKKPALILIVFLIITFIAGYGFIKWPSSFVPNEDQGYFITHVQLPDGSSLKESQKALNQVSALLDSIPEVENYLVLSGYSMLDGTNASNCGAIIAVLTPWEEREEKEQEVESLVALINSKSSAVQNATVFAFSPPAISGLGTSGGFEFMLQDRSNFGTTALEEAANQLSTKGYSTPGLMYINSTYSASVPQLMLNIDRDKVDMQQLDLGLVYNTISSFLGSSYVNDFAKYGRIYQVKLQAGTTERAIEDDILKMTVRNKLGKMVPFSAFMTIDSKLGPELISRYNMYTAVKLSGQGSIGTSSGQAMTTMEKLVNDELGTNYGYEWTSMAYQEKKAGSSTTTVFILAFVLVIMVLACQYESVTSPFAVIMSVPMALLGVVFGCLVMDQSISIYTQIGIVLLIALAAKNAILIVEFARSYREGGDSIDEAALKAGKVRLRPILMTSFAFILGVMPLITAKGAGAASRISLGTAVFFGMSFAAFLGTFFIPSFYQFWQKIQERGKR